MEDIVGQRIKELRPMSRGEARNLGWDAGATVLVLEDGRALFASRDREAGGAGALYLRRGPGPPVEVHIPQNELIRSKQRNDRNENRKLNS